LIAWLSRARIRAGYHSYSTEFGYRGDFFTHKLVYTGRGHQSEIYMNIFNALDCNKNDFPALKKESLDLNLNDIKVNDNDIKVNDVVTYKYRPFKCDVDRLKKKLNKIGVIVNKKIKIVLINSNCGDIIPLRKWPEDKYIKVTEMLLNKFSDLTVIYTGDKSEITRTQSIVSRINSKNCISMAGLLDLKEFIILISLSNLLLTNDSGPAHFCSLTDTPSLVLFGPESPHRFGPFGANVNVIWLDMPCSPCVNAFNNRVSECSNNLCMKDINAKMVFNKIVNILK
jgi:ADP-heptose:LPS heptosyltransferase